MSRRSHGYKRNFSHEQNTMIAGFVCQVGSCGLSDEGRTTLDLIGLAYDTKQISFTEAVELRDRVRSGDVRPVSNSAALNAHITWLRLRSRWQASQIVLDKVAA